ncbi:hypothetical protein F4678DRAFT_52155 [Xylaria arbuscula]|nr:hypothetical protein F4678DRAFT_52155 [Xylaria arbuscula]
MILLMIVFWGVVAVPQYVTHRRCFGIGNGGCLTLLYTNIPTCYTIAFVLPRCSMALLLPGPSTYVRQEERVSYAHVVSDSSIYRAAQIDQMRPSPDPSPTQATFCAVKPRSPFMHPVGWAARRYNPGYMEVSIYLY